MTKKFPARDNEDSTQAFERMAQLLLHAIGLNAVEGDRAEYDNFRSDIERLQTSLAEDASPSNVLFVTGGVVEAIQDYNRRASQFVHAKCAALQSIFGLLGRAAPGLPGASAASLVLLQDLQKQIEAAVKVEHIRALKLRLSKCLDDIRNESESRQAGSSNVVSAPKQTVDNVQAPEKIEASREFDGLTGLPLRAQAQAEIKVACDKRLHMYAGAFALDRIQTITTRFGPELSDQVLVFFVQHLSQNLSANDQLFRWGPSSFLALLDRCESGDEVRRGIDNFLCRRLDHTFQIGSRSVTLPVACTSIIVPLFGSTHSDIVQKLEAFSGKVSRT